MRNQAPGRGIICFLYPFLLNRSCVEQKLWIMVWEEDPRVGKGEIKLGLGIKK